MKVVLVTLLLCCVVSAIEAARLKSNNYGYKPPQKLKPQVTYYQTPKPVTRPPPRPKQTYKKPAPKPQNTYSASNLVTSQQNYPQMPYDFEWGVEDSDSGNSYSHTETNDGKTTSGQYRVLLPDGRVQIVTFSDNGGGYVADVTYE